jgi:hypothetical protein
VTILPECFGNDGAADDEEKCHTGDQDQGGPN